MTISSVSPTFVPSSPASAGITPSQAFGLASTAVGLSGDAGVLVMLGGSAPATDTASQLYSALAAAGPSTASANPSSATSSSSDPSASSDASIIASATGSSTDSTVASTTASTASNAAGDVNADWTSILKSNPSLAPLVEQLSVQQSLVDTFA